MIHSQPAPCQVNVTNADSSLFKSSPKPFLTGPQRLRRPFLLRNINDHGADDQGSPLFPDYRIPTDQPGAQFVAMDQRPAAHLQIVKGCAGCHHLLYQWLEHWQNLRLYVLETASKMRLNR